MNNKEYCLKKYCRDIENVENYEKAKAENFKGWSVHHRLETHNSDGERRLVDIKSTELAALDMYWNRPASELIFLTVKEHNALHRRGKHPSEETRRKISEASKNISDETRMKMSEAQKGKHLSEETRRKISEARKGKQRSEETKKRISEVKKGKKRGPMSEEQKKKISAATRDRHYYNNGEISVRCYECPKGFVPGKLKRKEDN